MLLDSGTRKNRVAALEFCEATLDPWHSKVRSQEAHTKQGISSKAKEMRLSSVGSKVFATGTKIGAMMRTMTGLLLTLAAAFITAGFFSHSKLRIFVPLGFVVVLIAVSARFGALVGVLGSLVAALVFAHRLFAPLGAVVEDIPARENLAWMVLASVALSFLLFPPPERRSRR